MTWNLKVLFVVVLSALCALATVFPALAQGDASEPSPSLVDEATTYAQLFDVSLEQAVQRLQLQQEIGDLSAALIEEEADDFAGLWIEHEPRFQVVARFRGAPAAEQRLQERLAGSPLAALVEVRSAARSLAQLREHLSIARHVIEQNGFVADLAVNVRENRVEVYAVDAANLRSAVASGRVQLPASAHVVQVDALPQPENHLIGGTPASTCTWGFTVRRNSTYELGILTAAHCGNTQAYVGTNLPFRSEDQQGNQDVQWHSACDLFDVTDQFESGIGARSVTGTRTRDQQAVGSLVCKNGKTTGRTCGIIEHKTYAPHWVTSAASTFIYVDGDQVNTNLSEGGDSGSPWFVEDYAYGIHSGGGGNDSIYMPINYISSLGVSVLTTDPGVCNLRPVATFTYQTYTGSYRVDFDASGSYDPDGSIASYQWTFGDGYSSTRTSPYVTHHYSTSGYYSVRLTVTDNEGATGTYFGSVYVGDCNSDPLEPALIACDEPIQ